MKLWSAALILALAPALFAQVSFTTIAEIGDVPPGRETDDVVFNGRAFQTFTPGVFSRPSINESGTVVFRAESSGATNFNFRRAFGLYAKTTTEPMQVLVDTSRNPSDNAIRFPVPGRPAGTEFTNFKPPLLNDAGDVVFYATFGGPGGSGSGFYATNLSGGPIVKLVDVFDEVPGHPGTQFNRGFAFGGSFERFMYASVNNAGQVVFMGNFQRVNAQFQDGGWYGTTVAGGPIVRLADTTQQVIPASETTGFNSLSQTALAAIDDAGMVIFQGGTGTPSSPTTGVWKVHVSGVGGVQPVAKRFQTPPGTTESFHTSFAGQDINNAGQLLFSHSFFSGANALYAGSLAGGPLTRVVDTRGSYPVPGRASGVNFSSLAIATINESGQLGFFATDTSANGRGLYATTLAGGAPALVAQSGQVPPGRVAPAVFTNVDDNSAAVNELGHMAFTASGSNGASPLMGLYFYNACTAQTERVFDDANATTYFGRTFAAPGCPGNPCETDIEVFRGPEVRSGHYRTINSSNDIGVLIAFSTFDSGIYIAHVETGPTVGEIICPADVTVECDADTDPDATGAATAVEGCTGASLPPTYTDVTTPGTCPGNYTIERTWTATDSASNVLTCTQTINVRDTTPPDIVKPDDFVGECGSSIEPEALGFATATDNCDGSPTITYVDVPFPVTCPQEVAIARIWTATDACGNASPEGAAQQVIFLIDTTAPTLTAPMDATIECGESTDPANTGDVEIADNCDPAVVSNYTDEVVPGACPQEYTITRTWTATDACGNPAEPVSQTITVADSVAPTLTVPADVTLNCGGSTDPADTGMASAADGCDPAPTVTHADTTATVGCTTTITRTWTATDACNNSATAVQTITIEDTSPPQLVVPPDVTIGCEDSTSPAETGGANGEDNCELPPGITYSDESQTSGCTTTITRTWTATDGCGNFTTGTQIITREDNTPPTFSSTPANLSLSCSGGIGVDAWLASAVAEDTCSGVTVTNNFTALPACGAANAITITWTATDECGNFATTSAQLAVEDNSPPVFSVAPGDQTVECDGNNNVGDLSAWLAQVSVSDDCGEPTVTNDFTGLVPACDFTGTATVTWTATDACGNTAQHTATFSVVDTTPPEIACPADVEIEPLPGQCSASGVNLGWPTSGDACSAVTVTNNAPAVFPVGTTTVTWTATDACGLQTTCQQTVVVADSQEPFVCVSIDKTLLWPPNHNLINVGLTATISDACQSNVPVVVQVYSNEDDVEPCDGQVHSPDAKNIALTTLRLRSERKTIGLGRVYLVVVRATDSSGNQGVAAATVIVPHSRNRVAILLASAQAAYAQLHLMFTGNPPASYHLVGDGPVIGPKQ